MRALTVMRAFLLVGLTMGCESPFNQSSPIPGILAAIANDGEEAASFPTEQDIPTHLQLAKIERAIVSTRWNDAELRSRAEMEYFGNRGSMTFNLHIQGASGVVTPPPFTSHTTSTFMPQWWVSSHPYWFTTAAACGQTANVSVAFHARTILVVEVGPYSLQWNDQKGDAASAVQPECSCEASGGGTWADARTGGLGGSHVTRRDGGEGGWGQTSSLCGTYTGPPGSGGGGPPGEPIEPHCAWYRDFVVYSDGSWSWWGGWYWECEGGGGGGGQWESLRAPNLLTPEARSLKLHEGRGKVSLFSPTSASHRNFRLVRLLGMEGLPSGRVVEVHWIPALSADAVVLVDLERSAPADLESALFLLERSQRDKVNGHSGSILGPPAPFIAARATPTSRAAQTLAALATAPHRPGQAGRSARVLEITIPHVGNRRAASGPAR